MKASRREIRFLIVDLLRFKYALESNSYLPNKHWKDVRYLHA